MNIEFVKKWLDSLGFVFKNGTQNSFSKFFKTYEIAVTLDSERIEKSIIDYKTKIKLHRNTTTNFSQSENLVILECVCRLLEKGYSPNSIELEKSWNLGHTGKGFVDILVKNAEGNSLFIIECKNWGASFNKEKNKMFRDGGQLLSYFRQDRKAKALCLYASKLAGDKIVYTNEIIDTSSLNGENDIEIFNSWDKTFNKKGIFENSINCYEFKNIGLTYGDLDDLEFADGQTIFHQFAEILRRHIVSDKSNAFNKILNLFICKIQDEDTKSIDLNIDLDFQFKVNDNFESLFDRLNNLFKKGLSNYINIIVPYVSSAEFEAVIEHTQNAELRKTFYKLRYYRSYQEFAFKDVYDEDTFIDNAEIVKEVVKLLQKFKIKYSKEHQYLGDFFELLLNTGFKQESGQFFTPIPLTRFVCKSLPIKQIIDKKIESDIDFLPYVLDYASGSGHFITEIMDEIDIYVNQIKDADIKAGRNAINNFNSQSKNLKWAKNYVYAIEKDYRLVKISKVSSFLNGDGDANVICADGLAPFDNDKYKGKLYKKEKGKENNVFDIIVANPPYSVSGFKNTVKNGKDTFELFNSLTDKSSEIECLFLERTKQLMKDGAVAGIVLPISILTNGGIYEKAREFILDNFYTKAIVSTGSGAFMATGTKTIILFLEKRQHSELIQIKHIVNRFFTNFNDVIYGGVHNAFSTYVRNVYEDLTFEDYVSILQNKSTKNEQENVLTKEYNSLSYNEIIELEKQKLIYFFTTYSQKVVLADSGEKNIEKEFYGYEFSNRRGSEGIYIYKDEEGNLNSKLYNPEFEGLEDPNKLNSYILRNYKKDSRIEQKIAEIQISDDHPLKEHIHYVRLSQLMSFDLKKFDKSLNLNKRDNVKIESKWKLVKLGEVCEDIISGSTPSKRIREYWNSKDINWATIKDFTSLYIENTMQHISRKGLEKVRIVPVNSNYLLSKFSKK
ncbi:N-6 DNA methylase [Candidatus Tisiphia endosymbiont of Ditula angustiorana]|uniref:N-6 DNA methylase n=1 Tax=Candidatus Tisiphia endosymbiont of Ditula angustiorana TaxID=3066272 RepID=UPI00312CBDCF